MTRDQNRIMEKYGETPFCLAQNHRRDRRAPRRLRLGDLFAGERRSCTDLEWPRGDPYGDRYASPGG